MHIFPVFGLWLEAFPELGNEDGISVLYLTCFADASLCRMTCFPPQNVKAQPVQLEWLPQCKCKFLFPYQLYAWYKVEINKVVD